MWYITVKGYKHMKGSEGNRLKVGVKLLWICWKKFKGEVKTWVKSYCFFQGKGNKNEGQ